MQCNTKVDGGWTRNGPGSQRVSPWIGKDRSCISTHHEDKPGKTIMCGLVDRTNTVNETVPKNKLRLFSRHLKKRKSPAQQQLLSLKHDRNLFSTLYIACQVRDAHLDDFFHHENHSFPPSLSDYGNRRFGTKADLLQCLEDLVPHSDSACSQREVHMIIIDGAASSSLLCLKRSMNMHPC